MDKKALLTLQNEIEELEYLLANKKRQLEEFQSFCNKKETDKLLTQELKPENEINNQSPPETKIALFRSLFKGREDVAHLKERRKTLWKQENRKIRLSASLPKWMG